jgi:uncharacterized protein (DUF2235 family)
MSASPKTPGGSAPSGKTIVLFSDGTGNSSAKLFKTNVWRMYEAVDLGPPAADRQPQIAYYDDGVGTSGFKPLAVLGGAFGYGLKRNVLDIYKYACRNYKPGDRICAFGFSRGAFTIRLVVALITAQGLVTSSDEGELNRQAQRAYRELRREWLPRKLQWPTRFIRRVRDKLTGQKHYNKDLNEKPDIAFVGVWDTVSAYGGPVVELTRAIDDWIFPLTPPDYELSDKVLCARHALALDDERDSFHPLLWDEVHEAALVAGTAEGKRTVDKDRLQQVWFTGMHSDVGGGYPDESLSYVSLLWMMEEAKKAKVLRTLDVIKDRFKALASSAGPIHDSRKGLAAYYRYQPRKIAAWIDPGDARTLGLRDPQISAKSVRQKGLLTSVKVHESVISRITCGTDRYAPITLPETFTIFPPQAEGENVPQADSGPGQNGPASGPGTGAAVADARATAQTQAVLPQEPLPMVEKAMRDRLEDRQVQQARAAAFEQVWDLVWRRRIAYFVTVGFTLLLATMPIWSDSVPKLLFADGRTWIDAPLRVAGALLPGFVAPWLDTFADNPAYAGALLLCIWLTMRYSTTRERRLRDRANHIWHAARAIEGPLPEVPAESRLARFRNSFTYQWGMQKFKWTFLPFVFIALIALVAAWLGAAGITQASLPTIERGTTLCQTAGEQLPPLQHYGGRFAPSATCHAIGQTVANDARYRVELRVEDLWFDGSHPTNPMGLRARDLGAVGILGGPFRRVIEANYLQPVVEIRRRRDWPWDSVHINPLALTEQEPGLFAGEFKATQDGELFVFANDAVALPWPTFFYQSKRGRNHGLAYLSITRLTEAPVAKVAKPESQARAGR